MKKSGLSNKRNLIMCHDLKEEKIPPLPMLPGIAKLVPIACYLVLFIAIVAFVLTYFYKEFYLNSKIEEYSSEISSIESEQKTTEKKIKNISDKVSKAQLMHNWIAKTDPIQNIVIAMTKTLNNIATVETAYLKIYREEEALISSQINIEIKYSIVNDFGQINAEKISTAVINKMKELGFIDVYMTTDHITKRTDNYKILKGVFEKDTITKS